MYNRQFDPFFCQALRELHKSTGFLCHSLGYTQKETSRWG
jgi:hypothetical protein